MTHLGGRLYLSGSIAMILAAGLHTLGQFAPPPPSGEFTTLLGMMRAVHVDLGLGMRPSMHDMHRSLAFTMSITLLAIGVFGVLIARAEDRSGRLLRRAIVVSTIATGAMVALYAAYRVPPPLLALAVVEALFLAALVRALRA